MRRACGTWPQFSAPPATTSHPHVPAGETAPPWRRDLLPECHRPTRTGDPARVVMAGAHLDSVRKGPGMNDDGEGVATLWRSRPSSVAHPSSPTRCASPSGVPKRTTCRDPRTTSGPCPGASPAISCLSRLRHDRIIECGLLVLGGEGKTPAKSGPRGSAQVACVLVEQLAATGVVARTTTFDRESDYAAFIDVGIPTGGVWSGDRKNKSGKQARRWGGRAGELVRPAIPYPPGSARRAQPHRPRPLHPRRGRSSGPLRRVDRQPSRLRRAAGWPADRGIRRTTDMAGRRGCTS